jgi:hypothetical protein
MKCHIEVSSVAEAEADSAFLQLSQVTSLVKASQWYSGLLKAIESLSQMPKRCPLARENEFLAKRSGNYFMVEDVIHTVSFSLS